MWALFYASTVLLGALIYHLFERLRAKAAHHQIVQREGCLPPLCLRNQWFPPFGLDKLGKVTEAERSKTYPLLMLGDHERYGDTYAQWGGPVYTVITRDTGNIRALLSKQFKSFEIGSSRHGCVRPLLGDGIFTQDGLKWEASRKLLAPMIQRSTLPELGLIERHFQILQKAMMSASAVNVKDHLLDLSLKLTTEFLLGEELRATTANSTLWTDDFAAEYNTAFEWISKRERLKALYWVVDSFQFRKSCSVVQSLVDDAVCHAQELRKLEKSAREGNRFAALDSLLRQERDPELVRDQFMNLLLAGRDTSGASLCWAFYALAREPQVLTRIRQEIENIVGRDRRAPTKSELNSMTTLDQFFTETLRVFPPVPLNGRFSTEHTFLPHGGGKDGDAPILIPKGTLVAFSTFATHRNKDLYGRDASRFDIGRWNDHLMKERRMVDWSYHPFLGGPRKCLGERFAITQAKYLICRSLQYYQEIIPTDEAGNTLAFRPDGAWVDDVKYHVGLTMMPDAGVWLRFVPAIPLF